MAIQDYLGGINIFGTPIPTGILDPKQEEKLRNKTKKLETKIDKIENNN